MTHLKNELYPKFKKMFYSAKKEILNEHGAEKELKDIKLEVLIGLTDGLQRYLERIKNG